MKKIVPHTNEVYIEILELSNNILDEFELGKRSIEAIYYKVNRLCRLSNDMDMLSLLSYEISGYPDIGQIPKQILELAIQIGRCNAKGTIFAQPVKALEEVVITNKERLKYCMNIPERERVTTSINAATSAISKSKNYIYQYVLEKNIEIKFSQLAQDVFSSVRDKVDELIDKNFHESINKLSAIYNNLQSNNNEDWSNAVHSCRRVLQDLSDVVFPPSEPRTKNGKQILLDKKNYINRLVAFIEDSSKSKRFNELVGSHLYYIGNRIDSIYGASNKGSHVNIVDKDEASRYVVYTYLLLGDILSLTDQ